VKLSAADRDRLSWQPGDLGLLSTEPVEKLFHHFDPSELRGKDGKWISAGDLADHAIKDIPNQRDPKASPYEPTSLDRAIKAARNGEPHKAGRMLRESAMMEQAKPEWAQAHDYIPAAKKYADAFSKLPDDSPDEVERENKFLIHHAAHPKLMDDEAEKQADALDRVRKKFPGEVADHTGKAAESLRSMDFDGAIEHLNNASHSQILSNGYFSRDNPGVASATRTAIAAAQQRARKAADYSWDMRTYGLYQPAMAMVKSLHRGETLTEPETRMAVPDDSSLFSSITAERARTDTARGHRLAAEVAKWGPHGYEHGWVKEPGGVAASLPESETAEEATRTAAARRYAKKVRKLEAELERLRSGTAVN
jgi:hypothetical protein